MGGEHTPVGCVYRTVGWGWERCVDVMGDKGLSESRTPLSPIQRHKRWLILAAWILILIPLLTQVSHPAPPIGEPVPPVPTPSSRSLIVLDLNILHGYPSSAYLPQRLDILQNQLDRLHPDVVFLQEVPWYAKTGLVAQRLADDRYAWLYARANGNRHLIRFEEGEAILSRYSLTAWETYELFPQARPFEHRIVMHAIAHLPAGDLHLFVVHLTDKEIFFNKKQAANLYRYVEETAGRHSALIAGDFNALPKSPSIRQLKGWHDLFAEAHPRAQGYTCCVDKVTDRVVTPSKRIDYIFYRPGPDGPRVELQDIHLVFTHPFATPKGRLWLSDHFGLLAHLILSP